MARSLDLRQVSSAEERRRRKAVGERSRRAAAGSVDRAPWLARNNASATKPWPKVGISKATWHRRTPAQQAAMLAQADEDGA